jgi:hypothetical protein
MTINARSRRHSCGCGRQRCVKLLGSSLLRLGFRGIGSTVSVGMVLSARADSLCGVGAEAAKDSSTGRPGKGSGAVGAGSSTGTVSGADLKAADAGAST